VKPAEWIRRVPWTISLAAAALMAMGLLGLARCEDFGGDEIGGGQFGTAARHLVRQQSMWAVVGLAVMFAATLVSYRRLAAWSYLVFAASIALLVLVYLFPSVNGAHRWLKFGRIGVQPSEFAKVAFVCALARYLMYRENYRRFRGLLPPLLLATMPVLLILKEPDLGTAAVFLPVLLAMLFVAGARRGDLMRLVAAGVVLLPLFWMQMSPYQKSRVTVLLHPPTAGEKPSANAYQTYQARTMMSLGGPWGSFISGQPTEDISVYRLPEDDSDFILCVLIERYGLPGLAMILALYGLLVWRIAAVAAEAREPFGRLLAAGVAALIAVQVLMNAGVTVGLLPVTGLPLPLVSHGGSGLVAHCLALGLVINVALRPGYEMTNEPFRWRE
jgi:cell division protein FtsW (lipid II flippase)